jgi:short-subunit dehydrogenase
MPSKTPKNWNELPRRAWVTGAGKGIGRALALRLAGEGWTVLASARTEDDLASLVREADSLSGDINSVVLDITDPDACQSVVERMVADGPLGLAVLNAGTHAPTPAKDFNREKVSGIIDVNLKGTINCLTPVMSAMRHAGLGKISIVASVAGYKGLPNAAAYCASKSGVIALCESLYPELREEGVSMSVINPGFVKTPLTDLNEFPMPFLMDVEDAVDAMMKGLKSNRFEIAFPTRFVLILKILRLLPDALYFKITGKMLD